MNPPRRFVLAAAALAAFAVFASGGAARAANQFDGRITAKDVAQLVRAIDDSDTSRAITVNIDEKKPEAMPASDPLVYYAGITKDGERLGHIWIEPKAMRTDAPGARIALRNAQAFAVMDWGFAGAHWKALYDEAKRADDALPAGVRDRALNRHKLIAAIRKFPGGLNNPGKFR